MNSIAVANFFWEGSALGAQEYACISSFCMNGFTARVYSYRSLKIPPGAVLCDAATVLPARELRRYTQGGSPENLAAFSDAFRYRLLRSQGGWWFDTDVICLAPVEQFASLVVQKPRRFSAGWEDHQQINGAVLYVDDAQVLDALIDDLERVGDVFEWGAIGPKLITSVLQRLNLARVAESSSVYYPIHYNEFIRLYEPDHYEWCKERADGALAVHLWNEFRARYFIPSTILPPAGSFVYRRLLQACPSLHPHRLYHSRLFALWSITLACRGTTTGF